MIINKADDIQKTSKDIIEKGLIKVRLRTYNEYPVIPEDSLIESVWCYLYPEYKKLYDDPNYEGKISGIILNTTTNNQFKYGDELMFICSKEFKPVLDEEWYEQHK